MDRRPPGGATIVIDMKIMTFDRTIVIPLSLIVLAVADSAYRPRSAL
jgi:hypothetical protein